MCVTVNDAVIEQDIKCRKEGYYIFVHIMNEDKEIKALKFSCGQNQELIIGDTQFQHIAYMLLNLKANLIKEYFKE